MSDDYWRIPSWGVVRTDGKPWPAEDYAGGTVDDGHVLVCDGPADAAACTLHPGDPDTHPSQAVRRISGRWESVSDAALAMRVRAEEGRARQVAEAVERRMTP